MYVCLDFFKFFGLNIVVIEERIVVGVVLELVFEILLCFCINLCCYSFRS